MSIWRTYANWDGATPACTTLNVCNDTATSQQNLLTQSLRPTMSFRSDKWSHLISASADMFPRQCVVFSTIEFYTLGLRTYTSLFTATIQIIIGPSVGRSVCLLRNIYRRQVLRVQSTSTSTGLRLGDALSYIKVGGSCYKWLGSVVVRVLVLRPTGRRFTSRPSCFWVQPWISCSHTCTAPLTLRPYGAK